MNEIVNKMKYTLIHWYFYQKVAFQLGVWKIKYLFHDIDKIILLLITFNPKLVSKLHRKISSHHPNNIFNNFDIEAAIIDWECARFTKPDKPLNAEKTLIKYYPQFSDIAMPILKKLKLTF